MQSFSTFSPLCAVLNPVYEPGMYMVCVSPLLSLQFSAVCWGSWNLKLGISKLLGHLGTLHKNPGCSLGRFARTFSLDSHSMSTGTRRCWKLAA